MESNKANNWEQIASVSREGRKTDKQCLHRWRKVLDPAIVKGPWTPEVRLVLPVGILLSVILKGNVSYLCTLVVCESLLAKRFVAFECCFVLYSRNILIFE